MVAGGTIDFYKIQISIPLIENCSRCVTGSYDRTARLWDVETGTERFILQGHQNAVFAVEYNFPAW